MIKKSVYEDELIYGMQRELQPYDKKEAMNNLPKAADYLQAAMEIFEASGLTAQADKVLNILAKIATGHTDKNYPDKRPGEAHEDYLQRLEDELEESSWEDNDPRWHTERNEEDRKRRDSNDAKHNSKKGPSDPHTKGLTPERMVENLKHHGIVFNMADDGKADDMLEADVPEEQLEVTEPHHSEKSFEDEEDGKVKTASKYGQQTASVGPQKILFLKQAFVLLSQLANSIYNFIQSEKHAPFLRSVKDLVFTTATLDGIRQGAEHCLNLVNQGQDLQNCYHQALELFDDLKEIANRPEFGKVLTPDALNSIQSNLNTYQRVQ